MVIQKYTWENCNEKKRIHKKNILFLILVLYLFSVESVGKSGLYQSGSAGGSAVSQTGNLKT